MLSEQNFPAREFPLPVTSFYSVEYPGYVQPSSVTQVVHALGGQSSIDSAFRRSAMKSETVLELSLHPGNPFSHPIPGDVVATSNIVLKIVKRKRRKLDGDSDPSDASTGEYTARAIGVIPKTVRFRSIADYQFTPDMNDSVAKLRLAMDGMDVDAIMQFKISEEKEDHVIPAALPQEILDPQLQEPEESNVASPSSFGQRSNLRMFPPPIFSRQGIPQNYNFKANPASIVTSVIDDKTGEEKKRLINRMRWAGYGPASILFTDNTVPDKPPRNVEEASNQIDEGLLGRLRQKFKERPVWTRLALFNQFTVGEVREIQNSKLLLALACYVFQDGPWRDTLVGLGYDPRKDVNARIYQRLYFRNANHSIERPSVISRRQEGRSVTILGREGTERRRSHIFDGLTVTKETAAFQLCDIEDRMLKEMIASEDDIPDVCHERDGWYSPHAFERIKIVLRHKFFSLLEGYIPTDEECRALLDRGPAPDKRPSNKFRPGKHNMAKGAMRPEEAAALRLRAKLDSQARALQNQRDS